MFKTLSFRWRERTINRIYRPLFQKVQIGTEEYQQLNNEWAHESMSLSEERRLYYQGRMMSKAHSLLLPTPKHLGTESDDWEKAYYEHGAWLLTDKAIKELRKEIREELKARRDMAIGWMSPFNGIIGTIVGFLLAWFSK